MQFAILHAQIHSVEILKFYSQQFFTKISWNQRFLWQTIWYVRIPFNELISRNILQNESEIFILSHCGTMTLRNFFYNRRRANWACLIVWFRICVALRARCTNENYNINSNIMLFKTHTGQNHLEFYVKSSLVIWKHHIIKSFSETMISRKIFDDEFQINIHQFCPE